MPVMTIRREAVRLPPVDTAGPGPGGAGSGGRPPPRRRPVRRRIRVRGLDFVGLGVVVGSLSLLIFFKILFWLCFEMSLGKY